MKLRLWAARSGGVAFIAALLSLSMVTPSVAVEPDLPDSKPFNGDPRYKYGIDYFQKEWTSEAGHTKSTWTSIQQQINKVLNPSASGGTTVPNTSNTPLSGKIIEPGKTPAKPPAVYVRPPAFAAPGALGVSRLLGTAGVGIGGVSVAPSNARQIALNQGVSTACLDNNVCSADEINKRFAIGSCQHLTGAGSCSSIGATKDDGTPLQPMMETLIPLAADLWSWLTGQGGDKQQPVNGHYEVTSQGCKVKVRFEKRDGSNGTLHVNQTERKGYPASGAVAQNAWNAQCHTDLADTLQGVGLAGADRVVTECIDPRTRMTAPPLGGSPYGVDIGIGITGGAPTFRSDGTNVSNLCDNSAYTLMKVKVYNTMPQTYFDQAHTQTNGVAVEYTEWVNPDPDLDTIEDTTITTNWTCKDFFGVEHNLSRTITKVAGFVEPSCPPGTDLVKHDVQHSNPGAVATTIDSGAALPGASTQYPDCALTSCALTVKVDGVTCTVINTACQTWPQINAISPSRVQCSWGTYTLPTDNCLSLSNAYKSEIGTVFEPKSQTWTGVDVFGNPIAPNPEPWNPTNPAPTPGTAVVTTPSTPPTTGTGTIPSSGPNPSGTHESQNGCMGTSWSWNPIDWVLHPVACVIEWAFEPSPNKLQDKGGEIMTSLQVIGVAAPFDALNQTISGLPQGGGCEGPTLTFAIKTISETMQPLNACSGVMNTIANTTNAFGSVYLLLFGSISVVRAISNAFGYSFTMGKASDN